MLLRFLKPCVLEGERLAILRPALFDDVVSILLPIGLSRERSDFLTSKAVCESILKFWLSAMLVRGVG
jgi:hypothetical protein